MHRSNTVNRFSSAFEATRFDFTKTPDHSDTCAARIAFKWVSIATLMLFAGQSSVPCVAQTLFSENAKSQATKAFEANNEYNVVPRDNKSYDVDFSVVVTAPYHTKVLKVWLPLPPSDNVQSIAESRITTFPTKVQPAIDSEPVFGNTFAYFEFHDPKGAQIIRHRFRATVGNLNWNLEHSRVQMPNAWPKSLQPYLRSAELTESADFQEVLRTFQSDSKSQSQQFYKAIGWVDQNLTYDHVEASLSADARHAFSHRKGHCSDYHGLCATFGRAIGFPTRVTYGLALFPKQSPSHCKLEAFLPPFGWVSFDISETQKLVNRIRSADLQAAEKTRLIAAAQKRLLSGFRENSWLLLTRGTNYELVPKATRPVDVVRTIYAEADGEPLPEPDPANHTQRKFSWMTVHDYRTDGPVVFPFKDFSTLKQEQ